MNTHPAITHNNIYLDDTIETIKFEKDALEIKFKHNVHELSTKNILLSNILKELITKEREEIVTECELFKKMIDTCISIQDSLTSLDVLEKKTEILKQQVNSLKETVTTTTTSTATSTQ